MGDGAGRGQRLVPQPRRRPPDRARRPEDLDVSRHVGIRRSVGLQSISSSWRTPTPVRGATQGRRRHCSIGLHRRTNTRTERSACRCHAAGTRILGHDPHRSCSDRSSAAIETTGAIRAAGRNDRTSKRCRSGRRSVHGVVDSFSAGGLRLDGPRRAPFRPRIGVTSRQKTFRHSIPPQLLSLTPPTTRGSVCRHSKPWRAARQWLRVRSEH